MILNLGSENCFRKGTIGETWKVEQDRRFDPAF